MQAKALPTGQAKIILVGRYPPPTGGVAVHVRRLAQILSRGGRNVHVLDWASGVHLRFGADGRDHILGSRGYAAVHPLLAVLACLWRVADGSIVHFHISSGRRFYWWGPIALALTRRSARRILTMHGGAWVSFAAGVSDFGIKAIAAILRRFDRIVCVNRHQREFIVQKFAIEAATIPAYLPPVRDVADPEPLPEAFEEFVGSADLVAVTSGCRTEVYDYETILSALELLESRIPIRVGLLMAVYGSCDRAYWDSIVARIGRSPVPVLTTENLSAEQFVRVLERTRFYIRATVIDGDAVALREAGAAGSQVLASDCVERPAWCALFRTGDPQSLASVLERAIVDPSHGFSAPQDGSESWNSLFALYS